MAAKNVKKATRKPATSVRSVRVRDDIWQAARKRATREGVTVNYVLGQLLEGYSRDLLDLPTVTKTYAKPAPAVAE
jgi:hypothetical protein